MNEEIHSQMSDLALMATELMVRSELEERGLDEKIKDKNLYDHVVKTLSALFMLNLFVLCDIYKEKGMDHKSATDKATEKARDIMIQSISAIAEEA